jgi:long-chain acyl-CoA synthetase
MNHDLRYWAHYDPDRLAVRNGSQSTSYQELEILANKMAHVLRHLGVRRGDHVAAIVGNDTTIFALIWGAYRIGAYITPIASTASATDAGYIAQDCDARLILVYAGLKLDPHVIVSTVTNAPLWLSIGGSIDGFMPIEPLLFEASATPVEDECSGTLMMYTSGTTGRPKGVWRPLPLTVSACPAFAQDLISLFDIAANSRYLSTAPLYHAAPLRFGLAFLAAGGSVIVMPSFDAVHALDLIESEGITHSQWVPAMFQRLLALDPARLTSHRAPAHQLALHGAAPCPIPVKRAMIKWWGPILQEYYSGSEGVGLTSITSSEWLAHPGSVGMARKGALHILDDADCELGAGKVGRVYFSGIPAFSYYKAPDKTADRTSRQGWQTFGDIGYIDEQGHLFLTDRQDDMIISGGVNIYPQELEDALLEMPELSLAAVIGMPDPDFGERPVAFVVPRKPPADASALIAAIECWCLERLGRIKRPREIRLVNSLPFSPLGKLLRRELRRTGPWN